MVSDAHSVHGNGVGGWRTYIPSSTDRPADLDWREVVRNAKAGQAISSSSSGIATTLATVPSTTAEATSAGSAA